MSDSYLPESARLRLERIRERAVQERAVRMALTDQQAGVAATKRAAEDECLRLKRFMQNKGVAVDQAKANAALDAAKAALTAINSRISALSTSATALSGRCEHFVKYLRSAAAAARPVAFSPKRGETSIAAVDRLRGELREYVADRRECLAAPRPASEAKAAIRVVIERMALTGEPMLLGALQGGALMGFSVAALSEQITPPDCSPIPSAFALLCWVLKDEITALCNTQIDALADDSRALSATARAHREAELSALILATERQESAAIEHAEATGVQIQHRSDVDVRAVLGLADNVVVEV